jgi:hypothetical protein
MDFLPWHSLNRGIERWRGLMSLRFRLIGLVCLILVGSLAFGSVIACRTASRSVQTEMHAALLVGRQTIENVVERLQNAADPKNDLRDLIASFKGNRHLRVWLVGDAAAIAKPSVEKSPFGGVPFWFTHPRSALAGDRAGFGRRGRPQLRDRRGSDRPSQ